jgi:hypothetical protein
MSDGAADNNKDNNRPDGLQREDVSHAKLHMQRLQPLQHGFLLELHLLLIQESGLHEERERRMTRLP